MIPSRLLIYARIGILILRFINAQVAAPISPPNCFDPTTITALTFYGNDAVTTNARDSSVAQLSCVGGSGCSYASKISAIQCQNEGCDELGDIQWVCAADIPSHVEISKVTVSCEGCTSETDEMKKVDSCALKYHLELTAESSSFDENEQNTATHCCGVICRLGFLVWVLMVALLCFCGWFCCCKHGHHYHRHHNYIELRSTTSPLPVSYTTTPAQQQQQQPSSYAYTYTNPSAPSLDTYQPSAPVVAVADAGGYRSEGGYKHRSGEA